MTVLDRILLGVNAGLITIITWFIRSWILSINKRIENLEQSIIQLRIQVAKNESSSPDKT